MTRPDDHSPAPSEGDRTSVTNEVGDGSGSAPADTDAQRFVQKTISESGTEAQQVNPLASGSVSVGSMLGPYQIVRKVGQGGMGAVYEARHTKLKKTVAVKVLPPEMMKSPVLITRFEREIEAVGALDHPNIVRAMDAGEFHGTHFLVMEYVDGSDLSVLVNRTTWLQSSGTTLARSMREPTCIRSVARCSDGKSSVCGRGFQAVCDALDASVMCLTRAHVEGPILDLLGTCQRSCQPAFLD